MDLYCLPERGGVLSATEERRRVYLRGSVFSWYTGDLGVRGDGRNETPVLIREASSDGWAEAGRSLARER